MAGDRDSFSVQISDIADSSKVPIEGFPGEFYPVVGAANNTLGWECPKCGAVLAPKQLSCLYCLPRTTVVRKYS